MTTEYAFPHENSHTYNMTGMTLRDYFAAKALQGMLARERPTNPKAYAQNSYEIADAMMEARK
jgi:hypothetical protein